MELHTPTLALVTIFIAAILGGLMLLAWRRDQSTIALVWWGIGYMIAGAGLALLMGRGIIPNVLSIEIANSLVLLSYSFLYAGIRAFGGRETPVTMFLVAPLIWLIAMRIPAISAVIQLRAGIVSTLQCAFVALTAYELWRGRAEPLLSRWPTIILVLSHGVLLNIRTAAIVTTPIVSDRDFLHGSLFGAMAFGMVLYTITFAFLLLSMTKERSELRHKIAALIDPLTGLANRRAFMSDADTMIAQRASRRAPIAVLLADLDHFKKINDVHGHSCGDRVLKLFAAALSRCTDQDDLAGRIGGEEFAILLTDKSEEAALAVAERVRCAFAEAAIEVDGRALRATVSIGVAVARIGAHDLASLLARADQALYRAKASGRNRVAAFAPEPGEAPLAPAVVVTPLRRLVAAG